MSIEQIRAQENLYETILRSWLASPGTPQDFRHVNTAMGSWVHAVTSTLLEVEPGCPAMIEELDRVQRAFDIMKALRDQLGSKRGSA